MLSGNHKFFTTSSGLSSLGVPGVPWYPQILADQLTLPQLGGADYAHHITTGTPGISNLATSLHGITRPTKIINYLLEYRNILISFFSVKNQRNPSGFFSLEDFENFF